MFVWAQIPKFYRELGSLEFSKKETSIFVAIRRHCIVMHAPLQLVEALDQGAHSAVLTTYGDDAHGGSLLVLGVAQDPSISMR